MPADYFIFAALQVVQDSSVTEWREIVHKIDEAEEHFQMRNMRLWICQKGKQCEIL